MKKLILLSFLLVATILVHAQRGGGTPEARAQKQVDRLTEQLNLSADQQTQMYQLFIDRQQNRKAGGKRGQDISQEQREAMKVERKAAKAAFDNNVAAILTPAQLETFQNLPKEGRGQGKKGQAQKGEEGKRGQGKKGKSKKFKGNRNSATPAERAQKQTDRLTEELALDVNQQAAVYDLILNRATANEGGRNWKKLSKEERKALRGTKQQDKATYESQLANILTPAQFEAYQNMPKKKGIKGKNKSSIKR